MKVFSGPSWHCAASLRYKTTNLTQEKSRGKWQTEIPWRNSVPIRCEIINWRNGSREIICGQSNQSSIFAIVHSWPESYNQNFVPSLLGNRTKQTLLLSHNTLACVLIVYQKCMYRSIGRSLVPYRGCRDSVTWMSGVRSHADHMRLPYWNWDRALITWILHVTFSLQQWNLDHVIGSRIENIGHGV